MKHLLYLPFPKYPIPLFSTEPQRTSVFEKNKITCFVEVQLRLGVYYSKYSLKTYIHTTDIAIERRTFDTTDEKA